MQLSYFLCAHIDNFNTSFKNGELIFNIGGIFSMSGFFPFGIFSYGCANFDVENAGGIFSGGIFSMCGGIISGVIYSIRDFFRDSF